jgi:hypothetical protein
MRALPPPGLLLNLLALEALFNHRSGQRRGWLAVLAGALNKRDLHALRRAIPERVNITPPFAGLLLGIWRKDLHDGSKEATRPFPAAALSSTLSARADRLLWGSAQPALFSAALLAALAGGGSGAVLAAPAAWMAFVIGCQLWGWRQGGLLALESLIRYVGSPRWSSWERRLEGLRRLAAGAVLGYWLLGAEGTDFDPLRFAAPALGFILALVWKSTPLQWGIAVLLIALGLGYALAPGGALP